MPFGQPSPARCRSSFWEHSRGRSGRCLGLRRPRAPGARSWPGGGVDGYGCMSATTVQPRKTMRASRRSQVTTRLLLLLGGVLLNWGQGPHGAEAAEVQASFATCGDKDGDGPGTENVTDADCAAIRDGYVARASSFDTVVNGREWDGAAWPEDFNACCEQGWEECYYAMWRGETCPDGMGFKLDVENGYDYLRCPEQPCDLTPGGADVEICCSEPVCSFDEMPRGYSVVEVIADCATGYVAGDYWTPSTTCPTGCTLTQATHPYCEGYDVHGWNCFVNENGDACRTEFAEIPTGDCVFVAAGIETCEDAVDIDYWADRHGRRTGLSELPEISCADDYTGTVDVTCTMGYYGQTGAYGGNFEYSGCTANFTLATCGDKDGDGPGTENVTDAECAAIRDGYVARASSFDTVLTGREWDGAAWPEDFNACCEQGWEECYYAMWRGETCPDGMGFKLDVENGYDYLRCPEQPCDLTPGGADVEICCSEPVCSFDEMPRGYSVVEVIADCATGYVAGDYWTPSTTCPTGCTLTQATHPYCEGYDVHGWNCFVNENGDACRTEFAEIPTGDCVFVAAGIETCEDAVDIDYWADRHGRRTGLSELPEISCADDYTGTVDVTCTMGYYGQTGAYGGNFEYSGCAPGWNLPQDLGQAEASTCASDVCGIGYVPKADQTLAAGTVASVANCCDAIVGSRPSSEQCSIRTLFSSVYGADGSEPFSAQGSSALETFRTHCRDWIASRNFNLKVGTSCTNERTCDVLGLLDDTSSYIEVCREVWLSMCSASP
eukprot:COSAG06_NODE_3257_length_5607_cov_4.727487_1_plen_780_part_00